MLILTASQYKALSEFLNTIAAAWFTAGVISPFFIRPESLISAIILGVIALMFTLTCLGWSLFLVRKVKIWLSGMQKIPTILRL